MHRVDITIKAFSKLVARGLNIEMVVVGGGSEAEYLQHMVNSMDLANVVRFTGMLLRNDYLKSWHKLIFMFRHHHMTPD